MRVFCGCPQFMNPNKSNKERHSLTEQMMSHAVWGQDFSVLPRGCGTEFPHLFDNVCMPKFSLGRDIQSLNFIFVKYLFHRQILLGMTEERFKAKEQRLMQFRKTVAVVSQHAGQELQWSESHVDVLHSLLSSFALNHKPVLPLGPFKSQKNM